MERLQALYRCDIIDTAPEAAFDELAALAASVCDTPIALIGFIDISANGSKHSLALPLPTYRSNRASTPR